jgi:hypothetical protein
LGCFDLWIQERMAKLGNRQPHYGYPQR